MIKVRYRKQIGDSFQEEAFDDVDYEEAYQRFEYATCSWAQVELVLYHRDNDWRDLVVLEKWGLY